MKNFAFLLAFLSLPVALVCPVKAGKISNGLIAIPSGLKPECGLKYQIYAAEAKKGSEGGLTWFELYKSGSASNKSAIKLLIAAYKKQGFVAYPDDKNSDGEQIIYVNNRTKKLRQISLLKIDDKDYLGVVGN